MHQVAQFKRQFAETIAWCGVQASGGDAKHSLRSPALRPHRLLVESDSEKRGRIVITPDDESIDVVSDIATRRSSALARVESARTATDPATGRMLIFFPSLTLSDGAAEDVSSGLFDAHNQPPWDTWIWYVRQSQIPAGEPPFLVCWMPECLVHLADTGIDANPEGCIRWIERAAPHALAILDRLSR
ncbi:MAG: hypothetical protein U0271_33500 [Polyangiaceae bacterium]